SSTVAPASALLSGLVVKPPAYLILRLWLEVFPKNMSLEYLSWVLGTLGALAVVFGSYYAIRQKTIKMLLAYSTVAQMGYLFLMVPIYYQAQVLHVKTMVLEGFALQALSHALAKASMFLSSGNAMYVARRDELSYMPGFAHSHPFTFFALFFSGATLIGLPLSGGFVAKFLLLKASIQTGFVFQGVIFLIGSLLAAMYVYPIWKESFSSHPKKLYDQPIPRLMELSAFILGFVAFSIGLVSGFLLQGIAGKD
ncbi:MAG: oxidoreductase, partial [Aquificota bacterium]